MPPRAAFAAYVESLPHKSSRGEIRKQSANDWIPNSHRLVRGCIVTDPSQTLGISSTALRLPLFQSSLESVPISKSYDRYDFA